MINIKRKKGVEGEKTEGFLWEHKKYYKSEFGDVWLWLVEGYKGEGISPGSFLAFDHPVKSPPNVYTLNLSDEGWYDVDH